MASDDSSVKVTPYTVDGLMERFYWFSEIVEFRTGLSVSFTTLIWAVFISSLLTAFVSYLILRLTRSGLDGVAFTSKFTKALRNLLTSGSEMATPRDVVCYVKAHAEENNPDMVLKASDLYSESNPLMHLGESKGKIVDKLVVERNPKVVIELGAYFGYSAVRTARLMKKGSRLISIEFNPSSADASRDFVKFAGLSDRVEIVTGSAAERIPLLRDQFGITEIDLVLIDHHKELYTSDLKLLEKTGLMKNGTVVLADNILFPGAPDYAKYVRKSHKYKSITYPSRVPEIRPRMVDSVEKSIYQG